MIAIEQRIQNPLELDYPRDKLGIIIASDGSTDNTVRIARSVWPLGVQVLESEKNRGRTYVHNDAVQVAHGEMLSGLRSRLRRSEPG